MVIEMRWDGVTPDQYDKIREEVGWESDVADGSIFHVAWFEDDALRVLDVWESAEDYQAFIDARLMAGVGKVGMAGEPAVTVHPAHRVFDAAHGDTR